MIALDVIWKGKKESEFGKEKITLGVPDDKSLEAAQIKQAVSEGKKLRLVVVEDEPTKEDDHYFNLATSITMNLVSMLRKERELGRNEGIDMVTAQTKDEISQAEKDRAALVERHANLYTGNAGVMVGMSGMGRDGKE